MSHASTTVPLLPKPRHDLRVEMFSLALELQLSAPNAETLQRQLEQNLGIQHFGADAIEIALYVRNLLQHDESDLLEGKRYFEEKSRGRRL